MTHLKFRPLGDVARLQAGVGFPLDLQGRSSGDYPLAKVGDISRSGRSGFSMLQTADHFVDKSDLQRLKTEPIPKGSVLFAKIGEAIRQNHRVIAGCDMLIDNNAMAAIPLNETVPEYLYHYLRTVDFYRLASATTVPALRKSELERLPVPWHAVSEQRRIADVLHRADALRAKRRAALAQLDTLTQSIFLDLFGDPVTNTRSLPTTKLGELGKWQSGGTPPRRHADYYEGTIPWFSSGELENMYVSRSAEQISEAALGKTSAKHVPRGALMLGMYDTAALKASIAAVDGSCNQAVAFCRFDERLVLNQYVYYAIVIGREHFRRLQRGVRQKNLNLSLVRDIEIPLPTIAAQKEFVRSVTAIENLRAAHRASLTELDALFASLQHRAFRGEL